MGLFVKYNCEVCGFSIEQSQGSGRAMPTESFNSDYITYTCRSCKTVGRQKIIHPIGKLKLQAGNSYFIRIWIDLIKTNRFESKWLQKLLKLSRWVPALPDYPSFIGRVYEENISDHMDSYLSVEHKIEFTNFSLLESEKQLFIVYRKLIKVRASIRESRFSEMTRKNNHWPSHEFVFELLRNSHGDLICLDDPSYGCPECHSTDFRYGASYCPVCDNLLKEETKGHWD